MDVVFLDANVLFSAAYKSGTGICRLWKMRQIKLVTSAYATSEARRNLLEAKQRTRLDDLLRNVEVIPASQVHQRSSKKIALPDKDIPIFSAAMDVGATHLLTGDVTHFGKYYGKTVEGILILPVNNQSNQI
jgi:predicted nucleic acid-binding protein